MTDAATLRALAGRVEAGDVFPLEPFCRKATAALGWPDKTPLAERVAYLVGEAAEGGKKIGLDACAALHEAVLGERWVWDVRDDGELPPKRTYEALLRDREHWTSDLVFALAKQPARAWLAAILKAKAAEMEG